MPHNINEIFNFENILHTITTYNILTSVYGIMRITKLNRKINKIYFTLGTGVGGILLKLMIQKTYMNNMLLFGTSYMSFILTMINMMYDYDYYKHILKSKLEPKSYSLNEFTVKLHND